MYWCFYDVRIDSGATLNFRSACVFVNVESYRPTSYSAEASSLGTGYVASVIIATLDECSCYNLC